MANLAYAVNQGPEGLQNNSPSVGVNMTYDYYILDGTTGVVIHALATATITCTLTEPGTTETDLLNAITAVIRANESDSTLTVILLK